MGDALTFRLDGFNPWSLRINAKDRMARRGRRLVRYTTAEHTSAAKTVELACRAAVRRSGVSFPKGPVVLDVAFTGARRSLKHGACECMGDADGPLKALADALTAGGAWSDDVQVVEIRARKLYAATSSLEVVVTAADPTASSR